MNITIETERLILRALFLPGCRRHVSLDSNLMYICIWVTILANLSKSMDYIESLRFNIFKTLLVGMLLYSRKRMSLLVSRFKVTEPKTTILISTKLGIDYEKSFGKRYGYEAAKACLHDLLLNENPNYLCFGKY
jgi:hypothetical protein